MVAEIQNRLRMFQQGLDSRVQLCALEATAVSQGSCVLTGQVLDEETAAAATGYLTEHFPAYAFDASAVQRLRQPDVAPLTVCTNLAGLHRHPSRISEMMSELLNGAVVEPLFAEQGWQFVRQQDGYLGWLHGAYLGTFPSVEPTHRICQPVSLLREEPQQDAPLVSRVLAGTAVTPETVVGGWVRLSLPGGLAGWLPQADLRPLANLPQDENGRRQQMMTDACQYVGVPYRWGGCSALGIDCSGLAQLLHRLVGIPLLRDADMQFSAGTPVEPPFQPGDLLFFGSAGGHRKITHVAVSVGGWHVIHSSGSRNGVYHDDVQAVSSLRDSFVGACTYL